jgi:hypothetical protein
MIEASMRAGDIIDRGGNDGAITCYNKGGATRYCRQLNAMGQIRPQRSIHWSSVVASASCSNRR